MDMRGQHSFERMRILETFQNNKAPGNDGIPVEFYKYWPLTFRKMYKRMFRD